MLRGYTITHCLRIVSIALLATSGLGAQAAPVTILLDAIADPTSRFIAYWSEGLAQLNMPYPGTTRQPFWDTKDLTRTYNNNFDFFPNEGAMKFGTLTYDDSSLAAGSGSAAITGLTLGIEKDPLDPSYINGTWLSFTTDLQTYSGSVTVANGVITGIDLTASYNTTGYFGAPPLGERIDGSGTFSISGLNFQVLATAYNPKLGDFNPSQEWNWTGAVTPSLLLQADFDDNDRVDSADLILWKNGMGIPSGATKGQGDADANGSVDGADFLIWQRELGAGTPPAFVVSTTVPEPAAASLLAIAIAGASRLRRSFRSGKPSSLSCYGTR